MKKLAYLGIGIVTLGISAYSYNNCGSDQKRREIRVLDEIVVVGKIPSTTLYFSSSSEAEQSLRGMAMRGEYEVAWLSDGKRWVDVSRERSKGSVDIDIIVLEKFLDAAEGSNILFYHFHSSEVLEGTRAVVHPPSSRDLMFYPAIKEKVEENGMKLVTRVVDQFGIWDYEFFPKLNVNSLLIYDQFDSNFSFNEEIIDILTAHKDQPLEEQVQVLIPLYEAVGATVHYKRFSH